ncbi:hypothetical protein DSL72_001006 [Monilinia vaccinii-corymbosi]|uniref:Uncharacterized protein n=1 Tax=Monilinia vaccinii-corymbosi TaxID=61207 RepID=A0A8A3P763_9HELO|nr:hypothetical protein DSL72_001006 [Monilinia vaccinii-corymbosi]
MSGTGKSSLMAGLGSVSSDQNITSSHRLSHAASSTEAKALSARRIQLYFADTDSSIPYTSLAHRSDDHSAKISAAGHRMSAKLQSFDARFGGQGGAQREN